MRVVFYAAAACLLLLASACSAEGTDPGGTGGASSGSAGAGGHAPSGAGVSGYPGASGTPDAGGTAGAAGTAGTAGVAGTAGAAGSEVTAGTGGDTPVEPMDGGVDDGGGGFAAGGGSGGTGGNDPTGPVPVIPPAPANCPVIATGNITVLGQSVQIWTGPPGQTGPMVFYWHGTGGNSGEAVNGLGPGLGEVQASGGVVASFTTTTGTGTSTTGSTVWHTGDFEMADIILACAAQQGLIDTRQVFTAGCSAGGLHASAMVYHRSSYLAGAMPNSGGILLPAQLQDPSHVPAVISTHGAAGVDVVFIDFSDTTARLTSDLASLGGFVVNCDHGGMHCISPAEVKSAQWEFLKAHPFGYGTSPYAGGLPAHFPAYCRIIN